MARLCVCLALLGHVTGQAASAPARARPADPVWSVTVGANATCAAFSPDARTLAVGRADGAVEVRDVEEGRLLRTVAVSSAPIVWVAFAPNGQLLLTLTGRGAAHVHETRAWRPVRTLEIDGGKLVWAAFSPAGDLVAAQTADSRLAVWDASSWSLRGCLGDPAGRVRAFAFAPGGGTVLTSDGRGTVSSWDPTSLRCAARHRMKDRGAQFAAEELVPSACLMAVSGLWVDLLELPGGKRIAHFARRVLAASGDGAHLAVASLPFFVTTRPEVDSPVHEHEPIEIWSTSPPRRRAALLGMGVVGAALSHDGAWLLAWGNSRFVRLFRTCRAGR